MGWGRMMLLGNVGQQLDIGELEGAVTEMQSAFLENQRTDLGQAKSISQLQRENHDLKLYLATLIRLLVSKGVIQAEEVEAIVQAVDTDK